MNKNPDRYMNAAIESARAGMKKEEGGPFGACIVKGVRIIAVAHNEVLKRKDATCHAEINAIRIACRRAGTYDLSGHVIYSTTEPCPMCFSAIHWARIKQVFYGTRIRDVSRRGFNELAISSREMKARGKSPVKIESGVLGKECRALLKEWDGFSKKRVY